MLTPQSQNKTARATFYAFEIAALAVAAIYLVLGIISAAQGGGFLWFVQYLLEATVYLFVLYGLGRVVDLLYCKAECHAKKEEKKEKEEEK